MDPIIWDIVDKELIKDSILIYFLINESILTSWIHRNTFDNINSHAK
jgi:hypothetical protein